VSVCVSVCVRGRVRVSVLIYYLIGIGDQYMANMCSYVVYVFIFCICVHVLYMCLICVIGDQYVVL